MIGLLGVATYWNSFGLPLVFDDRPAIERNQTIRDLSRVSEVLSPPQNTPVAGRPIVNLSLAVNYAIGGLDTTSYHLWNVALHIASALLLFALVRRTFRGPRLQARFAANAEGLALVAALLWMLHPLQTEVVDYLSQRSESMMAFFLLLTLYCAVRERGSTRPARWLFAAVLACALGMAAKESMVVAPLIVLLYDRAFEFDSFRDAAPTRWRLYVGLTTSWLLLAVLMWSGPRSGSVGFSVGVGTRTYLLNQFTMIVQYLRLALWPRALVVAYGAPEPLTVSDILPEALIVTVLLFATLVVFVRRPWAGFLPAAFFLLLAPTSSVIPIVTEVGAERRMYLPLACLTVLVTVAAWRSVQGISARWPELSRAFVLAGICTVALILVALVARTIDRTREYASSVTLWRTVVERRPSPENHYSLAVELKAAGDHDQAMVHLRLAHGFPDADYGLGAELFDDQKYEEAIDHLRAFLKERPKAPDAIAARDMIGRALSAQGKLDEAAQEFRSILAENVSNGDVHGNLAEVLFAQNQFAESIDHFRILLALRPDRTIAWNKLGIALAAVGRAEEAIECFQQAARLDPQSLDAQKGLTRAFFALKKYDQMELHAREALRVAPRDFDGHRLLGIALASQGKIDEAIDQFRAALKINPNGLQARENLELALRLKSSGRSGATARDR